MKALILNCTLKASPAASSTGARWQRWSGRGCASWCEVLEPVS
jgi:hypothetical protein